MKKLLASISILICLLEARLLQHPACQRILPTFLMRRQWPSVPSLCDIVKQFSPGEHNQLIDLSEHTAATGC